MKYMDLEINRNTNPGSSVISNYLFNGNNIVGCDASGTGVRPVYNYSTYAAQYQRYVVLGCSIKCMMLNASASAHYVGIVPTIEEGFPNPTDINTAFAAPYTRNAIINGTGASNSIRTFKGYMSTKKMWGIKDIPGDPDFQAATGTYNAPAKRWYWNCIIFDTNASGYNMNMSVRLTYYVKWFDRDAQLY